MSPIVAMLVSSQPANAVILSNASNTVSLCSGVQLPKSDVTQIMQPLINAVAPLETTTNSLLSGVGSLLGLPQLNTNIVGIMQGASNGNLTLNAVSTNGTILGPSDSCYAQASGLTLSNPAGISIGGNAITGMGDSNKAVATATELDAIAFGNAAKTNTGATGAIALGPNSSVGTNGVNSIAVGNGAGTANGVTGAIAIGASSSVGAAGTNSVAIGNLSVATAANSAALAANSIASRGALTNYAAFALTAPQTSVGEISVGSTGAERQITNVAGGSAGTDAVNVNQLSAVNDRITGLGNLAVVYDNSNHLSITLNNGGNSTIITNLHAGNISANSTDAINGSQLYNTNTNINNLTNTVNNINNNVNTNANNINITNNNVTNLGSQVNNIINGGTGPWRYSDSNGNPNGGVPTNNITIIGNGGPVSIHNVANGNVAANSTDAVNGGQLFNVQQSISNSQSSITNINNAITNINSSVGAIDNRVTNNTTTLTNLGNTVNTINNSVSQNTTAINNLNTAVTQNGNDIATNAANITNVDNRVTNVNNSLNTLTNTVNGNTTNIATNAANISNVDARVTNTNTNVTNLTNTVNQNTTAIATNATNITNVDARVTNTNTAVTNLTSSVNQNTTDIATNATNISNVDNRVSTLNSTVNQNTTDIATNATNIANVDARVTSTNTNVTNLTNTVNNNTTNIATNATNISNVDNRVSTLNSTVNQNTTDIATNATNIANVDTRVTNTNTAVTNLTNTVNQNTTDIATNAANITNVGNQVTSVTNNVTNLSNQVSQNTTNITTNTIAIGNLHDTVANGGIGPVQYSYPSSPTVPNGGVPTNDLTLVGRDERSVHLHNVANGAIASGSTDAVNGGQIFALSQNFNSLSDLAVTYDDDNRTSVTLGGLNAPAPIALGNIAAGALSATSTDAVNGSQLFATNINVANNTTNITNLGNQLSTDETNISNIDARVTNNTNTINNINSSYNNIDARVTQNSTDINTINNNINTTNSNVSNIDNRVTNINNQVTNNTNDITNLQSLVTTNTTDITNNTTNIANNTIAIGNLRDDVSNGAVGPVRYSNTSSPATPNGGTPTNSVTLVGAAQGAVSMHNVAAGDVSSTSTDAVNGSQLFAFSQSLSSGSNPLAVSFDNSNHTQITLGGSTPGSTTLITNLTNGNLSASSTDAVTGSQLFATNQNVASLNTQVTNNNTSIQNIDARVTNNTNTINNIGSNITNIDNRVTQNTSDISNINTSVTNIDNRVTQNTTNIGNIDARVTNNTNSITNIDGRVSLLTNGGAGPVQYANASSPTTPNGGHASQDLTLVGQNSGPVALHNVANGVIAHGSTDAVNGGQIADAISNTVTDLAVTYDDNSHTKVTLGGNGAPVQMTNVQAATLSATSTDAVNGSQLYTTNQNVANLTGDITNITNSFNTLNSVVNQNSTNIANVTNNFNNFASEVSNGGVGPVQYSDASNPTVSNGGTPSQDLTLIGAGSGPVSLHNVAAGALGATSTDAVNGSQLFGMGTAVANMLGGFTYNATNNSFAGNFTYGGNNYTTINSVLGAINADLTSGPASDGKYFHANSVMADSSASGQDSTAIGPASSSAGSKAVAMGSNASASSAQSVAIGSNATAKDGMAVSIGMGNTASGNGAVAIGDPSSATGDGAVVLGKDDNASGTGAIALGNTNTATGEGSAAIGSMNTVNGKGSVALGENNSASGEGTISIGSNNNVSGDGSLALGSGIVTSATDTMAIGTSTVASSASAVALGNRAKASGVDSLSVGTDTTATGLQTSTFGQHADATADYATAIGSQAQATTVYATAVGQLSNASGLASVALGRQASATGYASTALGSGAIADQDGSVALGTATQTVRGAVANYSAFGLSPSQTSLGEIAIARNLSYFDPTTGTHTPTGNRQITGLAAGSADTDAVNVGQLKGVSSTLGTALASSLGGGSSYNSTTGAITGPSYTLGGITYSNVGDALNAIASGTVSGTPYNPTGTVTATDPNAVAYTDATKSTVNLAASGTAVHNVADGVVAEGSKDAVNGGQLNAVQSQVTTLATQVTNGSVGAVQYSNAATPATPNGGTKTNDVTLVGANASAPVAMHNVAAGSVAADSTDAVNGSQLAATNSRVATVETTANTALSMSQNSMQYDDAAHSSATLGNSGTAVALHNVAAGVSGSDAVNVSQLGTATNAAIAQSNAYTDQKVARLSFDLGKVQKSSNAGTASALALAGMPQPYEAGRGMISGGVGTYEGQTAIAVGIAKALNDEHTVIKAGLSYNSQGRVSANVGVGYQF